MAGAQRVEGTLFGSGERTGNVCLATLALNMFSSGVDPQLDFSDIDDVRRTVEFCNQMPVHDRHPYAGSLVYTAFSGTHQDAIAKGFAAEVGAGESEPRWEVPYLPLDPKDVGRSYEAIIRVNSQSGKAGVAYVLKASHGLNLPRGLRVEFTRLVQEVTDESGIELDSRQLWDAFTSQYLRPGIALLLKEVTHEVLRAGSRVRALVVRANGGEMTLTGTGDTPCTAFASALIAAGWGVEVRHLAEEVLAVPGQADVAAYVLATVDGRPAWGVGIDPSSADAAVKAVVSAVNRAIAGTSGGSPVHHPWSPVSRTE
jgi:2-isopropylmalate synthase